MHEILSRIKGKLINIDFTPADLINLFFLTVLVNV